MYLVVYNSAHGRDTIGIFGSASTYTTHNQTRVTLDCTSTCTPPCRGNYLIRWSRSSAFLGKALTGTWCWAHDGLWRSSPHLPWLDLAYLRVQMYGYFLPCRKSVLDPCSYIIPELNSIPFNVPLLQKRGAEKKRKTEKFDLVSNSRVQSCKVHDEVHYLVHMPTS